MEIKKVYTLYFMFLLIEIYIYLQNNSLEILLWLRNITKKICRIECKMIVADLFPKNLSSMMKIFQKFYIKFLKNFWLKF